MRQFRRLLPVFAIGVMGNNVITLTPLFVGAMVSDRGFSEQQAGYMVSADLAGFTVATFCIAFLIGRVSWRALALAGVVLMLVANAATTDVYTETMFAAARFLSGVGGGVLVATATVALGRTDAPDRNFGILYALQLLISTAGLWVLPTLLEHYGLNGAYWMIVVLAVITGFAATAVPDGGGHNKAATASVGKSRGWWLTATVLVSVVVFFTEQNAVWGYAERIGHVAGLSASFIGFSLGVATLTGFLGAAAVAWAGKVFGRTTPLFVFTLLQVGVYVVLVGDVSSTVYLAAVALLAFAWNAMIPLQFGILADIDPTGKALALAATFTGVGLTLGPAIAAVAIGSEQHYSRINWLSGILALLTFTLLVPALLADRRRTASV